jgi:cytochrome c-type biogenesis protein CcmH
VTRLALVLLATLALAAPAVASERHPTLAELEGEVMCPECGTTLDQSHSAIATRIEQFIAARIAAGDTKSQIKRRLVANFGESILAEPAKHGFSLLAWLLPIGGILLGAAVLGALAWRWSRSRDPAEEQGPAAGGPRLDPELERRLDEELARFEA